MSTQRVSTQRDSAVDVARAMAILGMFVIHAVLVLATRYPTSGIEAAVLWIVDGRAAATFVTLAGFGVATLWKKLPTHERDTVLRRRGLILWTAGVVNLIIWPGDILRLYGVALALAPLMLRWSARTRVLVAVALVGLFPLVALMIDWTTHWDLTTLTYVGTWTVDGFFRNVLYDGFRPVLPWLAFFLVGTVIAEWPLHDARLQRKLIIGGALTTIETVAASKGLDSWLQSAAPQFDALTREGLVGTTSLPPMPLFIISAFGTTAILLGSAYALVPRLGAFTRNVLSATGRRALTWYVWHVVVLMSAAAAGALHTITAAQAIGVGVLLFGVAAAWSYWRRDTTGMLESWMRRSVYAMRMPTRQQIVLAALATITATAPLTAQPARDIVRTTRTWRESREPQIVRELATLAAIPNLASDSVNIRRNADTLIAMFTRRGFSARRLDNGAFPPAVYAERRTPGAKRTIVFYAHYDGQPVTPSQWKSAPWTPVLRSRAFEDGGQDIPIPATGRLDPEARLYARSVSDDKGPIVAFLAAMDALDAAKTKPSVNLKVFLDGEEEAGSENVEALLQQHKQLLAADAWIFGDGPVHQSRKPQIVFGVRGTIGAELTVYGPLRALHSGHYGNWAPNPAMRLANLLSTMRTDDGEITIKGFHDDVLPPTAAEQAAARRVPDIETALRRELGLGATEEQNAPSPLRVMYPSLDIRGIRSGAVGAEAANAIPTDAKASLSFRLVPAQDPARLQRVVADHLRANGWHLVPAGGATLEQRLAHDKLATLEWSDGYRAQRTSLDATASRAVIAVATEALGEAPILMPTLGGSLPMAVFEQVLQVPLLVVPIVNHDNRQHAADENLRLQNLWDGIELYAALVARLGSAWPTERPTP